MLLAMSSMLMSQKYTLSKVSSLVAQVIKSLPAVWETWVRSLGWEDPLEKEMATHSSTLAWRIPWTEEPGRLQSIGSLRVGQTTEQLHFHFSLSCIGEGNGNPLQRSCLENPRDGRALVGCRLWDRTKSNTTDAT